MPRLLIIDDRDQTVEMCHRQLPEFDTVTRCERTVPCRVCEERERGCTLKCAHDFREATEILARLPTLPDLVVLDLHFALPEERLLPEDKDHLPAEARSRKQVIEDLRRRQGLLILDRLRRDYPTLPVVMLTTTGADLGTSRPSDPLLHFCENEVIDSRSLAAEIRHALALSEAAQEGGVFWGKSRAMRELRRSIATLARSPLPILIEGETGTGKSFLAEHAIHPRSGAKGALVVTDLSTIPSALLPAHLFGARRGAYTGATDDHPGVFEQAHGGTLFLDEIANLDLELQKQLLLVLERGTVTRLGDARPRPAAPRLLAATNQALDELVTAGRFRTDLYMRLNPSTRLRVPPLRSRREDLPDLVRFALLEALRSDALRPLVRAYLTQLPTPEDFREVNNQVVIGRPSAKQARRDAFTVFLSRDALNRLLAHDWPGNHRELRLLAVNVLVHGLTRLLDVESSTDAKERAPAVLGLADDLVEKLVGGAVRPVPGHTVAELRGRKLEVELPVGTSFARISSEVERQYLRAMFRRNEGDLARMARELLGPHGSARKVHLRLNQLGLKLRELRAELA
jgi:DNA-binding NtrC family response regulator